MNSYLKPNKITRVLVYVLFIAIGIILVQANFDGRFGDLASNIGLAMIITGMVSGFEEVVLSRLELQQIGDRIASYLYERMKMPGMRLVSSIRNQYDGYYDWVVSTKPHTMVVAGRSVLHRIDYELKKRGLGCAEDAIYRRLSEGATIQIMFLTPKSNQIKRLAEEEGQAYEKLLEDIAISIGICKRLCEKLRQNHLKSGCLYVMLYDEIPYFAYHRVDTKVIVGFYTTARLGGRSAAYEIVDDETKSFFEGHFSSISTSLRTTSLLHLPYNDDHVVFNQVFFDDLKNYLYKERKDNTIIDDRLNGIY